MKRRLLICCTLVTLIFIVTIGFYGIGYAAKDLSIFQPKADTPAKFWALGFLVCIMSAGGCVVLYCVIGLLILVSTVIVDRIISKSR